jgi:hypothetical protein
MKCPVCELFGRELHFQTRRLLDQHSCRFHGLSAAQLENRDEIAQPENRDGIAHPQNRDGIAHPEAQPAPDKPESMRSRRFLH